MAASDNISVDASSLTKLAKDLRQAAPGISKKMNTRLRNAGKLVAADAKVRSSYSTRIPASVKVSRSGVNVKVVAGGPGAGDAAPIENRGKGFVRHPVYGNRDVWTAQNSHPAFLAPAFDSQQEAVVAEIAQAVTDALRDSGLAE